MNARPLWIGNKTLYKIIIFKKEEEEVWMTPMGLKMMISRVTF